MTGGGFAGAGCRGRVRPMSFPVSCSVPVRVRQMSRAESRTNHVPTLEALIREQMSLRDLGRDLEHGENMSFERQDSYRIVSGSFALLVVFLRQVSEAESFRHWTPPAMGQPEAGPHFRGAGIKKETAT